MEYAFSPATQALLVLGKVIQAQTKYGQILPYVVNPTTGKIIEIAKATTGFSIQSLVAPVQLIFTPIMMFQNHLGFQGVNRRVEGVSQQVAELSQQVNGISVGLKSLQTNIAVLQASTAVIGVGVAASVAISAVNLYQTLKLREEVKQLKLEVKDGFIDLKKALKDQGLEVIQRIDQVAQDIKYEQHRLELIKAYGRFLEGTRLIKVAMSIQELSTRKVELANVRQTLAEALSIYNNHHLLSETCAAGKLRRLECAWAIEQAIVLTYQLQDEPAAVSDRLVHLQAKIRQDSLNVIDNCESVDELDFIFPEIKRIHDHDLAVLESWQNHVDWLRSLPPSEIKLLESADFNTSELTSSPNNPNTNALAVPPEQLVYEELKQKSHPASLRAQLVMMMQPDLRREYGNYISNQAAMAGYKTLVPANLEKASNLTVANLYWYFKVRDESAVASA